MSQNLKYLFLFTWFPQIQGPYYIS